MMQLQRLSVLPSLLAAVSVCAAGSTDKLHYHLDAAPKFPVILWPGLGGSSLQAKWDHFSLFPWCNRTSDGEWKLLWLDPNDLSHPEQLACFAENMKCVIKDGEVQNHKGTEVRARDFGGVDGVSYPDPSHKLPGFYAGVVTKMKAAGWVVKKDLFGAPYDFRYGTNQIDDFYEKVTKLIEDVYEETGLPVSIFAHSMGPAVALKYLQGRPQEWKDKYMALFLAAAPEWSGSVYSVHSALSGQRCKDLWGKFCPTKDSPATLALMRDVSDSFPAQFETFPQVGKGFEAGDWDDKEIIISTPRQKFTAADIGRAIKALGLNSASQMHSIVDKKYRVRSFKAPLVDTHVFIGTGIATPTLYEYEEDFLPIQLPPQEVNTVKDPKDAGDGIVNLRSLLKHNRTWPAEQAAGGKSLQTHEYKKMSHLDTLRIVPDVIKILDGLKTHNKYRERYQAALNKWKQQTL